jgi:hypothetical protein
MIFDAHPQLLHRCVATVLQAYDGASLDDEADREAVAKAVTAALSLLLVYVCDDCGRHVPMGEPCPGLYCRHGGEE